jgi:hypothetical protein
MTYPERRKGAEERRENGAECLVWVYIWTVWLIVGQGHQYLWKVKKV